MSLIFISHDLDLVASLADRIYVMRNGIIEEEGEAHDLFNNPQTSYTANAA